jgi:PAS domain S-box-containing protein
MSNLFSDDLVQRLVDEAEAQGCSPQDLLTQLLHGHHAIERALYESEARYRGIVESQIDLVCLYDTTPRLLFVNDAYCHHFGRSREELIGKSFLDLVDSDQHEAILQRLADCQIDPKPRVAEVRTTLSDGRVAWIEWVDFGIRDADGQVSMIQAVGRDITRTILAEAELWRQEEYYRLLFENNPMPAWVYDLKSQQILSVNKAAIEHYQYSEEEFLSLLAIDLQSPEMRTAMLELLATPNLGSVIGREWRHRKKDGTIFPVEVSSHPIPMSEGERRLVLARDISERKQLEDERIRTRALELAIEKDRELMQLKERFISIVSHEFRTPLTVIKTFTDLLRRYYERLTADSIQEKLDGIAYQVKRMTMLMEDVLTLSRGQNGQLPFHPELTELYHFCRDTVEHVRIADQGKHLFVIENRLSPGLKTRVDRRLLEHVLVNLLSNAAKYSPVGRHILLKLEQSMQGVHVIVQDEGMGISETDLNHLFEPFYRSDAVSKIDGTGLGLAIVKQSVEAHGGVIECESRLGVGTTFTVTLPLISTGMLVKGAQNAVYSQTVPSDLPLNTDTPGQSAADSSAAREVDSPASLR